MINSSLIYAVRVGSGGLDYYNSEPLRDYVKGLGGEVKFRGHIARHNYWHYEIILPAEELVFFKLKYGEVNENNND